MIGANFIVISSNVKNQPYVAAAFLITLVLMLVFWIVFSLWHWLRIKRNQRKTFKAKRGLKDV